MDHTKFRATGTSVDLLSSYFAPAEYPDPVDRAQSLFDHRSAAVVSAATALGGRDRLGPPTIWPTSPWTWMSPGLVPAWALPAPVPSPPENDEEKFAHRLPDGPSSDPKGLLELKGYAIGTNSILVPRSKCLALVAYLDLFPDQGRLGSGLRSMVSRAILAADPGWCGTFGPGADGAWSLFNKTYGEGDYDMSEMHLLHLAYGYYDVLSPAACEHLITQLLARGRVHRPNRPDHFTASGVPNDWRRAGYVSPLGYHIDLGETENHVLAIATARYLTNQLLYQRDPRLEYDNRRNSSDHMNLAERIQAGTISGTTSMDLVLLLLRQMLRDDFSEYNAKPYQEETRYALLNLCSYAYDHEVRLGARMVLDYISAHMAVSMNDLRRLVPFRRRNEDDNDRSAHDPRGFMTLGLLEPGRGADPMGLWYAVQAGNLRGLATPYPKRPDAYSMVGDGSDLAMEAVSTYRIPPPIHDLFVNDLHRRFFQRLHRTPRDEIAGDRNCDNMEIFASSPSYLITAGGEPAPWALFPDIQGIFAPDEAAKQLGVAVTTSFMPTFLVPRTDPVFPDPRPLATNHAISGNDAAGLIQFGAFSSNTKEKVGPFAHTIVATPVANYGVAPDFACGHQMYLPDWVSTEITEGFADGVPRDPHSQGWSFVNMGSDPRQPGPGFFLALFRDGEYAVLEAYDTWLHRPRADDARAISFKQFKESVERRNGALSLSGNKVTAYTTENGTEIEFVIWDNHERRGAFTGAEVLSVRRYGDRFDALGDAGNVRDRFVNGTILNSPAPPAEAVVEISNPNLSTRLTLDFSDQRHPRRVSESGEVEVAGYHNEVWADFEWGGAEEGDAYRPFRTLKAAVAAAAPGGSVRIVPGQSAERVVIDKRPLRLVAPIGGVAVGTPAPRKVADPDPAAGAIDDRSVWVQFDSPDPNTTDPARPFNTVKAAIAVVAPRGVINVLPGSTLERITLTKRVTLVAPIGGVSIGALQLHW
ncbi:MAG: hypothetical protein QOE07_1109 [Acidimicrobiaceae bacterium]|nr:hypothetical protein [Acidimicrobiaceae bacterium]